MAKDFTKEEVELAQWMHDLWNKSDFVFCEGSVLGGAPGWCSTGRLWLLLARKVRERYEHEYSQGFHDGIDAVCDGLPEDYDARMDLLSNKKKLQEMKSDILKEKEGLQR